MSSKKSISRKNTKKIFKNNSIIMTDEQHESMHKIEEIDSE